MRNEMNREKRNEKYRKNWLETTAGVILYTWKNREMSPIHNSLK